MCVNEGIESRTLDALDIRKRVCMDKSTKKEGMVFLYRKPKRERKRDSDADAKKVRQCEGGRRPLINIRQKASCMWNCIQPQWAAPMSRTLSR